MRSVLQSHSANVDRTQDKIKKIACVTSGVFEGVDVGYPVAPFAFGFARSLSQCVPLSMYGMNDSIYVLY